MPSGSSVRRALRVPLWRLGAAAHAQTAGAASVHGTSLEITIMLLYYPIIRLKIVFGRQVLQTVSIGRIAENVRHPGETNWDLYDIAAGIQESYFLRRFSSARQSR